EWDAPRSTETHCGSANADDQRVVALPSVTLLAAYCADSVVEAVAGRPAESRVGCCGPPGAPRVNWSRSNSAPVPPVKTRYSLTVPAGALVNEPVTSWKFSQPPVFGTVADPISWPVGELARSWIWPPAPPDAIRAVKLGIPARMYGSNSTQ